MKKKNLPIRFFTVVVLPIHSTDSSQILYKYYSYTHQQLVKISTRSLFIRQKYKVQKYPELLENLGLGLGVVSLSLKKKNLFTWDSNSPRHIHWTVGHVTTSTTNGWRCNRLLKPLHSNHHLQYCRSHDPLNRIA